MIIIALGISCGLAPVRAAEKDADGWVSLFDGKTFDGWKITKENPKTFTIKDGAIVAKGPRAHLFYAGKVADHNFKNFELKIDVMTLKGSNGGVYFHTKYQNGGWPGKGFEVQVNNTHRDTKKSGGLYAVKDVFKATAKDGVWFTEHIIVRGKQITVKVDGKTVVEFTEATPARPPRGMGRRVLSSGTFALQGHDPRSTVYYKNIRVKMLDDKKEDKEEGFVSMFNGKDLAGWDAKPGWWYVEDGAITSQTTPKKPCKKCNYLIWKGGKPANFELRLKYKLIGGNSGVQIRSQRRKDWDTFGYQADMDAAGTWTGCVFAHARGKVAGRGTRTVIDEKGKKTITKIGDPAKLLKRVKLKDWNEYRIIAKGPELTLMINGAVMCQAVDREKGKAALNGIIALQVHPGPPMKIQFKDIRIKVFKD